PTASVTRLDLPVAAPPRRPAGEVERIVVRSALSIIGLLLAATIIVLLLWRLRLFVLLVLLSLFLATLLNPFVVVLVRRGLRRGFAVGVVYLALFLVGGGFGYLLYHSVYGSAERLVRDLPTLVSQARNGKGLVGDLVTRFHLARYISAHDLKLESLVTRLGKPALAVGKTVVNGVVGLTTIGVLTFFLLLEAPALFRGALRWLPPRRAELAREIAGGMARQVTGYMIGNLATSLIAGMWVWIVLEVTRVPFATVLAIWVAIIDFLPLIGGLLAGVPTVALAFLHSVEAGVVCLILFLAYQLFENHVLMPIVVSRTVRLNQLWVLLAVLVGAEIGSLVGSTFGALVAALLAVPAAGAIQVATRVVINAEHPPAS
ncbi:MAG TPA: AI-2E family transporter, partial [Acidimicrobiales bacterium]|nr:AI-2E family transporter [Acidimicrobiales bacterium]